MNARTLAILALILTIVGCSAAGGPPGDNDRWLLPLLFSLLFTAMFKFAEVFIKWLRNRGDHRPPQ